MAILVQKCPAFYSFFLPEMPKIAIYLPPGKVDFFTRGFFWAEELRDEVTKGTFDRWSVATKPKKIRG